MAIRFTNLLRDLIIENARFDALSNKYLKPKDKNQKGIMPFENLIAIIAADPTTRIPEGKYVNIVEDDRNPGSIKIETNISSEDMEKVKIGKWTNWILQNFVAPKLPVDHPLNNADPKSGQYKLEMKKYQNDFFENLYKITGDLKKFERFKNRLPQEYRDINKLTPETLYDQVKDFSLEKTKATKEEKKAASTTYQHPGAESVTRLGNWTVAKISDTGQLGKDAACFYGGYYLEPTKGETRWCTSSPGLDWFNRYIKDGPLYVVIPNSPTKFKGSMDVGEKSGLPALRYQFHFPSNQYMDPDDRQIELVDFLRNQEPELKEYFKHEFMKGLSSGGGKKVSVNYPSDSASKFIALYGFEEFFQTLPENIERLEFVRKGGEAFNLPIPESIGRFKDMTALHLVGCVSKLPNSICDLKNLMFLSLPDNTNLEPLPECIADLSRLTVLNLKNSHPEKVIPPRLQQKLDDPNSPLHYFG